MSVSVCVCMCVCVCLSVRDHIIGTSDLHQFLCMLPMAVARSSSDGVVMCYVFPVLRMTSYNAHKLRLLDVATRLRQ